MDDLVREKEKGFDSEYLNDVLDKKVEVGDKYQTPGFGLAAQLFSTVAKHVIEKIGPPVTANSAAKDKAQDYKNAFSGYYNGLIQKIASVAAANRNLLDERKKGGVKLSFTLAKNGSLIQEPSVVSSDDPGLIPVAIKTINQASPFAPFPESLDEDKLTFKVDLAF